MEKGGGGKAEVTGGAADIRFTHGLLSSSFKRVEGEILPKATSRLLNFVFFNKNDSLFDRAYILLPLGDCLLVL